MTSSQLKPLMPSKLPRIAVYLPPEIKQGLEVGAKKNRRTVSNMAAWIIEQWVLEAKKRGATSEERDEAEAS
jgi:CopG-like RHH_1 or ribbon-helix-helix domain, RHH_5